MGLVLGSVLGSELGLRLVPGLGPRFLVRISARFLVTVGVGARFSEGWCARVGARVQGEAPGLYR